MSAHLHVGDFIDIPAWQTFGCVVLVESAMFGSDQAVDVLLQEDPESDRTRRYRLEPTEYVLLDCCHDAHDVKEAL